MANVLAEPNRLGHGEQTVAQLPAALHAELKSFWTPELDQLVRDALGGVMPTRTSFPQGTPNWVDLQTTDQAAAKAFYAGLFGWTYDDQPMGPEPGPVYSMAMLGGHQVAAIAPQSPELAAAGAPPMWNTYLAVDSADDAAARVEAAGGKVAMAPFDVTDAGRMAFVLDPAGAAVALWQANQHIGATLVNEPGTVVWNQHLIIPQLKKKNQNLY